jgi:hypothetical protein
MNKRNKCVIAIEYTKIVKIISQDPKGFLTKFKKSFAKTSPKIEETGNTFKIKWDQYNQNYALTITNVDNNQVEITLDKSASASPLIFGTILSGYGFFWNGWSTLETISILLFVWVVIPFFFKYQSKHLLTKYSKVIENE